MKMNKLVVAMSMGMILASGNALAVENEGHGTVNFKGTIITSPCSITPDTVDQTVDLGQISNATLKDGGKSAPQNFKIDLKDCDLGTLKTVKSTFTGAASQGNPNLLGITGTASGASIAITDGSGKVIKLGEASAPQGLQDGNNTLQFSAYLQGDGASATVVPGDFTSVADFSLDYQ